MIDGKKLAVVAITMLAFVATSDAARAQDFFSGLFGAFAGRPPAAPMPPMSYGSPVDEGRPVSPVPRSSGASRVAFCVRSCDGRYFPMPVTEGESAATICNNFCPASPTKVMYAGSGGIDNATTSSGQAYTDLPNAYRYRNEMVSGCTCNGKDGLGLAAVKIEDDRTLRKGDIVAGADGLVIATGRTDKRKTASFTPAPRSIRSKFETLPVLAAE
jgi:hypothetical protein